MIARCKIRSCSRPRHGHGLCHTHYMRWWRTGSAASARTISAVPLVEYLRGLMAQGATVGALAGQLGTSERSVFRLFKRRRLDIATADDFATRLGLHPASSELWGHRWRTR